MKNKFLKILSIAFVFVFLNLNYIIAQMVGPNAYIKATSLEIGLDGQGGFEGCSTTASPPLPGMHHRSTNPLFGFVANPQINLWTTFDGDFFTPGTPENGWGIEIGTTGGVSASNNATGEWNITGALTDWTHIFDCYSADWEGDLTSSTNLHIKINYFLQETDLFYTTTVSITNNTASTIPELFYYRNLDPDNNVSISFDYTTQNTIVSQPGTGCNLAHVSATSLVPALQPQSYLGLAAVGANWRAMYGGFSNRDGSNIWDGSTTGFVQTIGATNFADEAIALGYKIENLAPGATEVIKFVVILDDAYASQAINNLLYLNYPGSVPGAPLSCTPYTDTIPTCGGPVPINVSGPNVSDYTWTWSPTTGITPSTGPSVIANPTTTTTYTVTGTPLSACVAPISFTFVVDITTPADATINPVASMCSSAPPFNFTSLTGGGTWTGTGITNASTGTFDPSIAGGGTFTIAHNIPGVCGDTSSITVTVIPAPTPICVVNDPSGCAPHCVTFTETVSATCNSINYTFGDGNTTNTSNPSHCYDSAGVYSVSIQCTDSNGCVGTSTYTNMITALPTPAANYTMSPSGTILPGTTVVFTNTSTTGANLLWTFGDPSSGSNNSILNSPTHTYPNEGLYCVDLYASNPSGCADSVRYCILVEGESTIFIPNVFSPNADGNNDLFLVSSKNVREITYDIYDRWGLMIASYNGITGGWNGETKNGKMAPDGVYYYILKATTDNGKSIEQEGFIHLFSEK